MTRQFSRHIIVFSVFCLICGLTNSTFAQSNKKRSRKKVEVPPLQRVLLETKDGVELQADWFGSSGGKEALPVILLHDWDSDRSALRPLAEYLQTKQGYAVIVPDLRGHGESLNVKGSVEELDRKRFRKAQVASMVEDIDTCRRFLQDKNDEGELNLDMLVVLACGKTNMHAAAWCISDWNWPPVGGIKQGQNVKTLIMVSPVKRFKGGQLTQIIKDPLFSGKGTSLPTLVVWGVDEKAADDAENIYEVMKKNRSEPSYNDPDERWEKKRLFRVNYDSVETAENLLREQGTKLFETIALLIDKKVMSQKDKLTWQKRSDKS